jgi:two-component system phosphate regulon response regulator PhoB
MPQAKILVIEDDDDIAKLEQTVLERADYEVKVTGTGAEGLELAEGYKPDVVILDIGLPDISGLDVCTSLSNSNNAFVLMVSGHSREQDVLLGLGLGADDYITKPFSPKELVARIKAVLRRRAPQLTDDIIKIGTLTLDPTTHRVIGRDTSLVVGPTEFRLLHFFMTHIERVFSRAQLLDQVWGDHVFVEERTVDVHIRRLRKALEPSHHENHIETVRGAGYRFTAQITNPV